MLPHIFSNVRVALAAVMLLGFLPSRAAAGPPALDPPPAAAVTEGRRLVAAMQANERGPYSRLRWFCADGTVHPPQPFACRDRGGGHQHGEYSTDRQRLAELGWPIGTILTATPWAELWDPARRNLRLRQLLVERYLVDVDDGWVLRKARDYRGRIQVEDEETAGRDHLMNLLSRPNWVTENFLLAREAVRALPHHSGTDRTQSIRRLSLEIADKDRSFENLRIKIHTSPGAADIEATRDWLESARRRGVDPAIIALSTELIAELEKLYGAAGDWLAVAGKTLARDPAWPELQKTLGALREAEPMDRVGRASRALVHLRDQVSGSPDGARNLALLDLSLAVERELNREAFAILEAPHLARGQLAVLARHLIAGAHGCGLLSERERDSADAPMAAARASATTEAATYINAIRALRRLPGWCLATVRYTFAEAIDGYGALEPKAYQYSDDVLRGSVMLPLAEVIASLGADADRLQGISHQLFGKRYGGLVGLNPGVARGRLRVITRGGPDRGAKLARDEIVVLPQTVSELTPVAGILTLAEGNLLSHVQLLARNLGIPNATLSPALKAALESRDGQEVLFSVSGDGSVVLELLSTAPEEVRKLLDGPTAAATGARTAVDPPRPDLTIRRPIPLSELSAGMAGKVVGPKAANLGELALHFPGRVEQAIALPFGVFADHVTGGVENPPKTRLDRAYRAHRAGTLDDSTLAAEIAAVHQQVYDLELSPELRRQLEPMMARLFGEPGSYGVFVRSDTNVEDLPGFTGAGLNETVAHVVDVVAQRRAVARVWASPFRERAIAWRAPLLTRPEEVYTSVLIMKSVPADKSGVMVTTDLVRRRPGLTVATAWGVGGAVDGDAAETVVLRPNGSTLLVGESKAPYKRRLKATGGVEWVPAAMGRVLADDEHRLLRELAVEVSSRLEPARDSSGAQLPWDIEFGFVGGRLALFQIRPLVERGATVADRVVDLLVPAPGESARTVSFETSVPVRSVPMEAATR